MTEPVVSRTYVLRISGHIEEKAYFTIVGNDIPIALFINSKSMDSFQWITALMTAYSRNLRMGGSIDKIISDMKTTFDPNGKYFVDGKQVHSIVHHIGLILEKHMDELKDRKKLTEYYEEGIANGLSYLDATTYAEETLKLTKEHS